MNAIILDGYLIRVTSFYEEVDKETGEATGTITCAPRRFVLNCIEDGKKHNVLFYKNPVKDFHEVTVYRNVKLEVTDIDTHKEQLDQYPQLTIKFKAKSRSTSTLTSAPEYDSKTYADESPFLYRECFNFIHKYKQT